MPRHSNKYCWFAKHPFQFTKSNLINWRWLETLPDCDCYMFALVDRNPQFENEDISLDEYQTFLKYSDSWKFLHQTKFKYNLRSGSVKTDRDPYVYEALKEYDKPYYYSLCNKNKSPRTGRMYFSLLQYLYPLARRPRMREFYFWQHLRKAMNFVMDKFKKTKPLHWTEAMRAMPKNTSAGFNGLQYSGSTQRKTKGEILPFISRKYLENWHKIINKQEVNDYCMFAMRGHLSERTKIKTRPVWLVSASTIVSELRFYQPFYDQLNSESFFKDRWITGKDSLPRLNRYLRRHPEATFVNTDIKGWDSYRAAWFHEMIIHELGKKLDMTPEDKLEFRYCVNAAIRTKVLFPDGKVYQKFAGIISGTAGTLLFNSLLNTIAGYTVLSMMGSYDLDYNVGNKIIDPNWLGDDFAFFTYYSFDLEKFSKLMFKYFCVIVSPDKTIVTKELEERKYLGYQLKGGFLYRETDELFAALLYSERPFPKTNSFQVSFSRFFSYLLIGGINDYKLMDFFYYYMGKYENIAIGSEFLYEPGMDNIFKLLKDVWNFKIDKFNLATFQNMHMSLLKYCLLYGYDLKFSDLF